MEQLLTERFKEPHFPEEISQFLLLDDESVFGYAKFANSQWAKRFLGREHFREVWASDWQAAEYPREYDEHVAKKLKEHYPDDEVIVDRFVKSPIRFAAEDDTPMIYMIDRKDHTEAYSLRERASIVSKLEEPIYIFRVYAVEKQAERVRNHIKKIYQSIKIYWKKGVSKVYVFHRRAWRPAPFDVSDLSLRSVFP